MKKIFVASLLLGSLTALRAAENVIEQPITRSGTVSCVSISTGPSTWTKVPPGTAMVNRSGIYVTVAATATANMILISSGSTTASYNATHQAILVKPGNTQLHIFGPDESLYMMSLNTGVAPETVCVMEIKQR